MLFVDVACRHVWRQILSANLKLPIQILVKEFLGVMRQVMIKTDVIFIFQIPVVVFARQVRAAQAWLISAPDLLALLPRAVSCVHTLALPLARSLLLAVRSELGLHMIAYALASCAHCTVTRCGTASVRTQLHGSIWLLPRALPLVLLQLLEVALRQYSIWAQVRGHVNARIVALHQGLRSIEGEGVRRSRRSCTVWHGQLLLAAAPLVNFVWNASLQVGKTSGCVLSLLSVIGMRWSQIGSHASAVSTVLLRRVIE